MKCDVFSKICTAILFAASVLLSWGGMIYATNPPDQFRITGVIVSFVGYALFFWTVLRYEKDLPDSEGGSGSGK